MATFFTSEEREYICEHHARSLMKRYISTLKSKVAPAACRPQAGDVVGIVGAGVGGLYTALMLESLDIPFEIIESSDRVGGRLFTHKFEKGGPYDYYDVGAMRYPLPKKDDSGRYRPGIMQRLGNLFQYLNMEDQLIPYYIESNREPGFRYFHGVRSRIGTHTDFDSHALGISPDFIKIGVEKIVGDVVGPFAYLLNEDLKKKTSTGWEVMMRNDAYSMQSYMSFKYIPSATFGLAPDHLPTKVVNWCETFDNSTGSYGKALTETVLDAVAFGQAGQTDVEWKCIDGGSKVLPKAMVDRIKKKVGESTFIMNSPVTSIGLENPKDVNSPMVVVAGGQERKYAHVISTLPLPVLRTVDLTKSNLDILQSNAIRQLQYGPSTKIGILFTEPWWTIGEDMKGEKFNIVGGQSFSDLPIRTVVYPSYGVGKETPSNTLIASYCWTSDAERLGALINTKEQKHKDQLERLVLGNLAAIHNVTYEYLKTRFVDLFAWDWSHDPGTMGAFAFFGPGNFNDIYTSLCRPAANNRLHFAGEALSVRHAWVVGALDSAWRAVYEYLYHTDPKKIDKLVEIWGRSEEWSTGRTETIIKGGDDRAGDLLESYLARTHHTKSA